MNLLQRLEELETEIDSLDAEIPAQLARIITLNSIKMSIYGQLEAAAQYDHGKYKSKRKFEWGKTVVETEGTALVKEGTANQVCYQWLLAEEKFDAEKTKWKNQVDSQRELIQSQKLELKLLAKELTGVDL